jgi:nucleoside 2-deoxyribosyltransferase
MPTCFVIQRFDDGGTYDKLYDEVFASAIADADLEPDRVDRDPSVVVPITRIQDGIRKADVCFAEISTESPNVWFELGYALALRKPVVIACSDERTQYPFDIQHRHIVKYKSNAPSDFKELSRQITTLLLAAVEKRLQSENISDLAAVEATEGLTPHEMGAMAAVVEGMYEPDTCVPCYEVRQEMERAGYTRIAYLLATTGLARKDLIVKVEGFDDRGNPYDGYQLTPDGFNWLEQNRDRFVLRRPAENSPDAEPETFDDVPF